MNKRSRLPVAVLVGLVPVVLTLIYACDREGAPEASRASYSHNLKYVRCNKYSHPNTVVEVEVKKHDGVGAEDKAIFVCVGDTVHWYTDDKDFTFIVAFDETSAAKDLFNSTPPIISHVDTSSHHKQVTDDLKVVDTVEIFKDFTYKPLVKDENGKIFSVGDPHIIPMGK